MSIWLPLASLNQLLNNDNYDAIGSGDSGSDGNL